MSVFTSTEVLRIHLNDDHVVSIKFQKEDGSTREMICCARPEVVGDTYDYKGGTLNGNPDKVITVWSVEDSGWRRLIAENFISGSVVKLT